MSVPLEIILSSAHSRLKKVSALPPLMRCARKLLFGDDKDRIIGTYDHLRSPFSNRLVTADQRLAALAHHSGVKAVLLCLDATMLPTVRTRNTSRGDQVGLAVFSRKMSARDYLFSERSRLLELQRPVDRLAIGSNEILCYVHDPIVTFLRTRARRTKREALHVADLMAARAHRIIAIYANEREAPVESHSGVEYLLSVRERLWTALGIGDCSRGISKVPISSLRPGISDVLQSMQAEAWFRRFMSSCEFCKMRLLDCTSDEGYTGSVYCEDGKQIFSIVNVSMRKVGPKRVYWDQICRMVRQGSAFPTTPLLYLIIHLCAGYPHFGNSHELNQAICGMIGIRERLDVDLTDGETNSTSVALIEMPLGVTDRRQRNVTMDALWYGFDNYRSVCDRAAFSGDTQLFAFGRDLPRLDSSL